MESRIARRKGQHLRIVAEEEVEHGKGTLLDGVKLWHQALPELDLAEVDTRVEFFGKTLDSPLMICSMSGGSRHSKDLNHQLAEVASRCGIAFSVGSQRILLDQPEMLPDFAVRSSIPDGVLLGNIGAVQLPQVPAPEVAELARRIEADGICVHLNVAQELCQPEGDRRFAGQVEAIARLVEEMDGRVLVKETGAGLAPRTLELIKSAGVEHVDVAGAGGTSWTRVEYYRAGEGIERDIAETFGDWGVPTAVSIIAARRLLGGGAIIVGSGGIQTGLDCARALAAGADVAGVARAVLEAWQLGGLDTALGYMERLAAEVRAAMLFCGCKDVAALQQAPRVYTGELRHWLEGLRPEGGAKR